MHTLSRHPERYLFSASAAQSRRASSWDRSGGNRDYLVVAPGATATLLEHEGPGCVQHLYCALVLPEITDYRDAVLRCFWDGERWPPSIHGTGTEEIFGAGACPSREYAGPVQGFHLVESADYAGLIGAYRWYASDPIRFRQSIRWTIEHGHANNFANDYASVAYWYQGEPHAPFPSLPARDAMRPSLHPPYVEAREALGRVFRAAIGEGSLQRAIGRIAAAGESFYAGRFAEALQRLR